MHDWWLERPPASGPAAQADRRQADLEAAALEALPRMLQALPPPPEVMPGAFAARCDPGLPHHALKRPVAPCIF